MKKQLFLTIILFILFTQMGGCTVLGMAADHAIDDLITDDDPDRKKDSTLMNEGLKKDL